MERIEQKSKNGISLIVLVITIIVIIILAVAVILSISNNNPIESARKARFLNDLKTINEEVALYVGNQYVLNNGTYNPSKDDKINDILKKYTDYSEKVQIIGGKVKLIENKINEEEKKWIEETDVDIYPVIPVGFKYFEGTVDDGYTIINETDGNEFVWVPVEDIKEFKLENGYASGKNQGIVSSGLVTEPLNYNGTVAPQSEIDEYNAIIKSVTKYNGFYIGRYEASDDGNGIAQSKKDKTPWQKIKWGTSVTDATGGAVEKARAVYQNANKEDGSKYAVSTLCYGVQWDAVVKWLEKTYPGISKDSSQYGNYKPTTGTTNVINTGSNPKYKTNNIYDMCGNCLEWTMAAYLNNDRIVRGGFYNGTGNASPISNIGNIQGGPSNSGFGISFRLALYVK